jgi:multidrug efflux system membrane fusion protein
MRIYILIAILLIISVSLFFKKDIPKDTSSVEKVEKTVGVKLLDKENYSKILKLRGFTEASRIVTIKSQVEGRISAKFFNKGSFYKAGEQLLLIDPEDKLAKVKEMEALLNQRKKEYEVAENLFKKGFRSEIKLSKSRTNFENALALYEKSQVDLNNTKVLIPFDSIIDDSFVELGDYLKKGDSIVKIVDLDPLHINLTANENDINKIKLNQTAKVIIGENKINGKVNFISKTSDKETRNFRIQVEIENFNNKIFSGLSSEIEIKLSPLPAFFIPSSLVTLNEDGKLGIKSIYNNIVKFHPINILSDNGGGYWIDARQFSFDKLPIINKGHEFTVEGEVVKFLEND